MGGREYVSRDELVAEIRRRFEAINAKEAADGAQPAEVDEVVPDLPVAGGGGDGPCGPGVRPELPVVRRRPRPRKVPKVAVVERDARRVCSWCARPSSKPLPPTVVEHRCSGFDNTLFLRATCAGPDSTVWRIFATRLSGARAVQGE
jgi:hypothetical protein